MSYPLAVVVHVIYCSPIDGEVKFVHGGGAVLLVEGFDEVLSPEKGFLPPRSHGGEGQGYLLGGHYRGVRPCAMILMIASMSFFVVSASFRRVKVPFGRADSEPGQPWRWKGRPGRAAA